MRLLERNAKGQVLVLVVVLMFVLIGMASLALDIGRAYGVKARLNAAVDAASFEATKAMGQGSNEDEMVKKAGDVAKAFFYANYPADGYLGAIPTAPTVTPNHDLNTGLWKVTVAASAQMPTFLGGAVGWSNLNVGATSESQRRSLDMVLVLDISKSMEPVFPDVKANAEAYMDFFSETDDRIGLVAFSTGAAPIVSICRQMNPPPYLPTSPPTGLSCSRGFVKGAVASHAGVKGAIGGLEVSAYTNSEEGMQKALDQLNSLAEGARSSTRVIVFFSDGAPNTFNGKIVLTGGGVAEGNLYSEVDGKNPRGNFTKDAPKPHMIFNELIYNDKAGTNYYDNILAPLTTDNTVVKSYNNMRFFSGGSSNKDVHCDANKAARNMAENLANTARSQGVIVYTLGLGGHLDDLEVDCDYTAVEYGTNILKRMANTKDSDTHNSSQPTGIYCHAATPADLKPCFDQIASAVLRITR
jgi:Flp pilus assembly protein TadG